MQLIERAHENQPQYYPSTNLADYEFIDDHMGIYAARRRQDGGNRVERDIVGKQKVVHAYGQYAGGFVNSFGIAREVARLVEEYTFESPVRGRL